MGKNFVFRNGISTGSIKLRRLADWVQDLKRSRPGWVNTVDESIWDRIDKWIACKVDLPMDARFFYIVVPRGLGWHCLGRLDLKWSFARERRYIRENDYRQFGADLSLSVKIASEGAFGWWVGGFVWVFVRSHGN